MAASWLPKVRVAACNVAPVFLDTPKTVQKTIGLIHEASRKGADLVVFPETYIPAYPLWAAIAAPIDNHSLFTRLAQQSLLIDGPEIRALRDACAQHNVFAHIGFNERSRASLGCIFNSAVLIDDAGRVRTHARKMAPTFYEKLIWAPGDGAGLKVIDSKRCGRVGALLCGENTNPLARYSLMAQGEQVHITTWPPVWPTRRVVTENKSESSGTNDAAEFEKKQYNNIAANRTRTAAHCFEAKCFGIMCAGVMDKAMRDEIVAHAPSSAATIDGVPQAASGFIDPTGAQIGEQIQGEEGIVYADFDLNACVEPKQFHDVVGGYQRFDIFDLKVDRRRLEAENAFRLENGDEGRARREEQWESDDADEEGQSSPSSKK